MTYSGIQYVGFIGFSAESASRRDIAVRPNNVWNGSTISPGLSLNPPDSVSWQARINLSCNWKREFRFFFFICRNTRKIVKNIWIEVLPNFLYLSSGVFQESSTMIKPTTSNTNLAIFRAFRWDLRTAIASRRATILVYRHPLCEVVL